MRHQVGIDQARTEEQRDVLRQICSDGVCPFCPDNLGRYHRPEIIKETEHWVLTENQWPYSGTRVHLLAIAKEHVVSPSELPAGAARDLFLLHSYAEKSYQIESGALVMRFGEPEVNGASVRHLHCHIISGDYKNPEAPKVKVKISDPSSYNRNG